MKVTIADYGVGNLGSVLRGFSQCGADITLASEPRQIDHAERLVVPGVGAFGAVMARLCQSGLKEAIRSFVETERPFLGICVGMQLMMDTSDEFGRHEGLGVIEGAVRAVPRTGSSGVPHKIPHIGWARLKPVNGTNWRGTLLERVKTDDSVYFIHSFTAWPTDEGHRLADADYDGCRIAGVIARGSVYGCQFHPEKSGPVGLRILESFLAL